MDVLANLVTEGFRLLCVIARHVTKRPERYTAEFGKPLPALPSTIISHMPFHHNLHIFRQIYECQLGKEKKEREGSIHGSEALSV